MTPLALAADETVKHQPPNWLLHVLSTEPDSTRLRAAANSGEYDPLATLPTPAFSDDDWDDE